MFVKKCSKNSNKMLLIQRRGTIVSIKTCLTLRIWVFFIVLIIFSTFFKFKATRALFGHKKCKEIKCLKNLNNCMLNHKHKVTYACFYENCTQTRISFNIQFKWKVCFKYIVILFSWVRNST